MIAIGKCSFYALCMTTKAERKVLLEDAFKKLPILQDKQPFDLPPHELKKLVQGIVWREEHFNGMTLQEIAKREKVSDSHIGKQIFRAFEFLKAQTA